MRHAGASQVLVALRHVDGGLRLVVRDDGRGLPAGFRGRRRRHRRHAGARAAHRRAPDDLVRPGRRDRGPPRRPAPRGAAVTAPLTTRILLADDHPIVLRGLRMVLDAQPDLAVVAEAGDGARGGGEGARARGRPGRPRRRDAPADRPAGGGRAQAPAPRAAHADALDVRQRAVLLRGAEGRGVGLRAQERRRPRPRRGLPGGDARRALPLPRRRRGAHPRLPRPRQPRRGDADATRSRRASSRSSSSSPRATRATRSPRRSSSPRRPSSTTAATSSRSSGCATASSSRATRSDADWSSPEQWPAVPTIYVTGHRNPDTDSIASAIGYAELKGRLDPRNEYVPVRLGDAQRADALGARARRRRGARVPARTSCCACAT